MQRTGALLQTQVPMVPTGILQANMAPEDYLSWLVQNNKPAELQDHLFNMLQSTIRDDRFLLYPPAEREQYLDTYKTLSDLITSTQQVYKFDDDKPPHQKK